MKYASFIKTPKPRVVDPVILLQRLMPAFFFFFCREHGDCPVTGCACKCMTIDSTDKGATPTSWQAPRGPDEHVHWWFLMRYITDPEIESLVGLCNDRPAGNRIKSKTILSTNDFIPYFELWSFISQNLGQPLLFPFPQQRKSVRGYFVCVCYEKN